jgi:ketosteroid isomerase-like protein
MSRRIHATAVSLALLFLAALALATSASDDLQSPAQAAIRQVLEAQQAAWNRGDLRAFMNGYWRSDKTEFVGASGVQRGWQAVLNRYRRSYPDRQAMGKLAFSDLEITLLSSDAAYVLGHYELHREADHPEGVFTLILQRFPEGWRIIHDHTTAFPSPSPM